MAPDARLSTCRGVVSRVDLGLRVDAIGIIRSFQRPAGADVDGQGVVGEKRRRPAAPAGPWDAFRGRAADRNLSLQVVVDEHVRGIDRAVPLTPLLLGLTHLFPGGTVHQPETVELTADET